MTGGFCQGLVVCAASMAAPARQHNAFAPAIHTIRRLAQALKSQALEDLEGAQRRVKLRTLGNIRLIAELFNKGVVAEKIVHACIADLLGAPKAAPVEDNAEVCVA